MVWKIDHSRDITRICIVCKKEFKLPHWRIRYDKATCCSTKCAGILGTRSRQYNLVGQRFGQLLVIKRGIRKTSSGGSYWLCQCSCGKTLEIYQSSLRYGKSKSCGCSHLNANAKFKLPNRNTREYRIWVDMRQRCNNPKNHAFKYYGARGIKVCRKWNESFDSFYFDMGPKPNSKMTLERINNNKSYYPDNCKWATWSEQIRNRRKL